MSDHEAIRVLVIEDDADTRANLCDILELDAYQVETAGTAAEALARDNWDSLEVIILDWRLPDANAEVLLPKLRVLAPEAAVIVSTGAIGLSGAVTALRLGAADYILKPIDTDTLRASLRRIAERKRLALDKARSEAAFRTLVEAAPCMILILRPDARTLYISPFAEELSGYSAEDVVGRDFLELFAPERTLEQVFGEKLEYLLGGERSRGSESTLQCRDGALRWVVWNAQLLPDYDGDKAILAVGQDITTLKQAQEQSLQAERLAAIGQMMTGLAHESGNALARSQACLEMLAMEVEDRPPALDLISRIQKAQDHLQRLYEEVRSYAAPVKLEREMWDVGSVWRQAWGNLALRRQGRDTILREHSDGLSLRCYIDPFRLEQVFRNILENSLAACPGQVEIDISCREKNLHGRSAISVSVRDNGPGLSPEQQHRIFDPFYTTKTKGTGLGMAIAQRIVKAHGGQIGVGTGAGRGAEIVIVLLREGP